MKMIIDELFNEENFTPFNSIDNAWFNEGTHRKQLNEYAFITVGDYSVDENLTIEKLQNRTASWWLNFEDNFYSLLNLASIEYNPIENYSMTETSTDTKKFDSTSKNTGDTTTDETLTKTDNTTDTMTYDSGTTIKNTGGTTTTTNITNDDTQKKSDTIGTMVTSESVNTVNKNIGSDTIDTSTTETKNGNDKRVIGVTGTDTRKNVETLNTTNTASGNDTVTHTLKRSGNIGVTTSQQMIESSLDLIPRMNIFNEIIDSWKQICVY